MTPRPKTPREIRAYRKRLGFSLSEIAKVLPVSRQTWHRWELPEGDKWHRNPPAYLWRALEHLETELGENDGT